MHISRAWKAVLRWGCGVCVCVIHHDRLWPGYPARELHISLPIQYEPPNIKQNWPTLFTIQAIFASMLISCADDIAIDQSHRYGRPQAACREPAGSYDKTTRTAICFEHKTQYLLIRAPYTRIVVFWHISNIPPMISQSQISCNTTTFYIAAIFVKYCYTTGSWLL